jgi:hypothetical protein
MIRVKTFTSVMQIFHTKQELDELDAAVNDFLAAEGIRTVVSVSDAVTTGAKGESIGIIRVLAYEEPADSRDEYYRRFDRKIRDWGTQIEELGKKADRLGESARSRYQEQADDLRALQEKAKEKLSQMRKASGEAWGDLRAGTEAALDELAKGVKSAAAKLKK